MFIRAIESELMAMAGNYPVVSLLGPRQSGKTTVVRKVFPEKPYINLEAPDLQRLAIADPRGLLAAYPQGAILDEVQNVPELLSYIQVAVDESRQKGMFILIGIHQLELHQAIAQSLAGRTALLNLLPLSIGELQHSGVELTLDEYLFSGFFPRIYQDQLNPTKAYRNYFQTYLEHDLRKVIHVQDLILFQQFMQLCAGRIGQVLNMESLGNELGISGNTIKHWLSILEASFIIFRLRPYFENFGKRIIKSPKIYFFDVGLAAYLLDIENLSQLKRDPLRGNLVENLVVLELMKTRFNQGLDAQLYYFRDSQHNEIDVIFKSANTLIPIEIKSSSTVSNHFFKNLHFFHRLVGERCQRGYVVYAGTQEQTIGHFTLLNFKNTANILSDNDSR